MYSMYVVETNKQRRFIKPDCLFNTVGYEPQIQSHSQHKKLQYANYVKS